MTGLKLKTPVEAPTLDTVWDGVAEERKNLARALTNLLEGQEMPLTLSINGSWGTGKTFFLKNWQTQLSKNGRVSIYFNSWEDDHCGDPLLAMIGQLGIWLKEGDAKEMVTTVKQTFMPALVKTFFKGLSVASMEVVDLEKKDLQSTAEQAVDEYWEIRSKRDDLKTRLTELAAEVKKNTGYPLIFIVDELDRCRPTFAIELLERVKHIFGVPNVVFVLGLDREQLGHSIKSVYGDIDVDGYLRRFFDLEFNLPKVETSAFIEKLISKHGIEKRFQYLNFNNKQSSYSEDLLKFKDFFSCLCGAFKLTHRDIEGAVKIFVLIVKTIKDNSKFSPEITAILVILRHKNSSLYDAFSRFSIEPGKVLDYLEQPYFDLLKLKYEKNVEFMIFMETNIYLSSITSVDDAIFKELEALKSNRVFNYKLLSKWLVSSPGNALSIEEMVKARHHENRFKGAAYASRKMVAEIAEAINLLTPVIGDNS